MNILMPLIASLIVVLIVYLDRWMWHGDKFGCFLCWGALVILGVVPVALEPVLAIIAFPFLLIQLHHSWKCNVSESC